MKTKDKILMALQQSTEYVSGEQLSKICGVSRVAVWKQIQKLQQEGHVIVSHHGKGYHLCMETDRIGEADILERFHGRYFGNPMEFFSFEEIDSTNLELKRRILQGARQGMVVSANHQTAGKGRLGRAWTDEKGSALTFSVLLEPNIPLDQTSRYSFVIAVSVAEGIRQATDLPAMLKWPNDVLVNGKKVCGILLEMVAEMAQAHYIIAGMGVNVNQQVNDFPEDLREKASSLAIQSGKSFLRADVLEALLRAIEINVLLMQQEGFEAIRKKWMALSNMKGKEIQVIQYGQPILCGTAEGIDENGALLIRTEKGIETVLTGDVSLRDKNGGYFGG